MRIFNRRKYRQKVNAMNAKRASIPWRSSCPSAPMWYIEWDDQLVPLRDVYYDMKRIKQRFRIQIRDAIILSNK